MSRDRLRVTKIFERPRKSLQQRIQVYRASRSPCFAHCEQDCSPSFTMLLTLCMMPFFFCFLLFCSVLSFVFYYFFFCSFCFYSGFVFFGGGGEVFLRVPLMNCHQSLNRPCLNRIHRYLDVSDPFVSNYVQVLPV